VTIEMGGSLDYSATLRRKVLDPAFQFLRAMIQLACCGLDRIGNLRPFH